MFDNTSKPIQFADGLAASIRRIFADFNGDAARAAYLDAATDTIDLEFRIRESEQPHRAFGSYGGNFALGRF